MEKSKTIIFYALLIGTAALLMWFILLQGKSIEKNNPRQDAPAGVVQADSLHNNETAQPESFSEQVAENLHHPLAILILQIITIIIISRIFGYLFNKIHQPTVIGEIVAGIFLGPSVLGLFFPEVSSFLFPAASLGNLQFLSQIGLIFFMFIIGMELDIKVIQNKAHAAVVISHSSIIFPYLLGVILAYYLYTNFAPAETSFVPFALFMGIAMSITAFPVLARIIQERGMTKTALGSMAITCAAADDITAWCILAAVVAVVNAASIMNAFFIIGLSIVYVFLMLKFVRPFLSRIGSIYITKENLNKTIVAFLFVILLISSYTTEVIGIHALFGAFLAGTIMPQNLNFKKIIIEKIEDISLVVLLPLFFVFTGLRTQIGLLNDTNLWLVCIVIIAVAVIGKFGGSTFAAKFVGLSWKESLSIGALMNTRGLMELIVLNIGYDLGILSPQIFAMMVLMALLTTFFTGPALQVINKLFPEEAEKGEAIISKKTYNIIISFAHYSMGSKLLKLANFIARNTANAKYTALHFTPTSEISGKDALIYEKESFQPIRKTAEELGVEIETIYKSTDKVQSEIIKTINSGKYNLLLLGSARPIFKDDKLGGKIKNFLEESNCSTAVLIDKNFQSAKNVLVLLGSRKDEFLSDYTESLIKNKSRISAISMDGSIKSHEFIKDGNIEIRDLNYLHHLMNEEHVVKNFDLIMTSINCWNAMSHSVREMLEQGPSVLLVKP